MPYSMAESELSVLSGQCLDRAFQDKQTLSEEVAAWETTRNKKHTKAGACRNNRSHLSQTKLVARLLTPLRPLPHLNDE
jgi:hypothetical protein